MAKKKNSVIIRGSAIVTDIYKNISLIFPHREELTQLHRLHEQEDNNSPARFEHSVVVKH